MEENNIQSKVFLKKDGKVYKNKPGAGRPVGWRKEKEEKRYMQIPISVNNFKKLTEISSKMGESKLKKPVRFAKFIVEEYIKKNG